MKISRSVWLDIVILTFMALAVAAVRFLVHPFERVIKEDEILRYFSYPDKQDSVPEYALLVSGTCFQALKFKRLLTVADLIQFCASQIISVAFPLLFIISAFFWHSSTDKTDTRLSITGNVSRSRLKYVLLSLMIYSITGFLYAVASTWLVTDSLNTAIGQPRPNFKWHCFPSGTMV
jgi:hypothetical protein